MALIDDVINVLKDLADHGWEDLFKAHGLNIKSRSLKKDLTSKPLNINRKINGFKDFAEEGFLAITPGIPSQSLLYHALASPSVLTDSKGKKLSKFPTFKQIEIIENFVYASTNRTISDLINLSGTADIGIAVFALEYRNSVSSTHKRHADLCFSRTGISRVGNSEPAYIPEARGFRPILDDDTDSIIRVLPTRYAAFFSIKIKGNESEFRPMFYKNDNQNDFWIPVHKLFNGKESIIGEDLKVDFDIKVVNKKLRRIHQLNMGVSSFNSGHDEPQISQAPFITKKGLAQFSKNEDFGSNLLMPIPKKALVQRAELNGTPLKLNVPVNNSFFAPSYSWPSRGAGKPAPDFIHVRDEVTNEGKIIKLNDQPNVEAKVKGGGYSALHYLDFTGDGYIEVHCDEIDHLVPNSIPAYVVVAACDFFPYVDQGRLVDWTSKQVPKEIVDDIWAVPPTSLASLRIAPNISISDSGFKSDDKSVTAVISQHLLPNQKIGASRPGEEIIEKRNSTLPDSASGVFDPGWDISFDIENGVSFLSSYGLGSPFPEDAKLCAALSTFWPAAAPDSSRQYVPKSKWPIVCPMTDEEIGLENAKSWDGNIGPREAPKHGVKVIEFNKFEYVDYTEKALNNEISIAVTSKVEFPEYAKRVLAMNRVFQALDKEGVLISKTRWGLLSFKTVETNDQDLISAQESGINFNSAPFKFVIFRKSGNEFDHPKNFKKSLIKYDLKHTLLYGGKVIHLKDGQNWKTIRVK